MTRKREYKDYLHDMQVYAEKAEQFLTDVGLEALQANEKKTFAIIRALEVIGEAARHIPPSVRRRYPEIPWKKVVGMRNMVIHGYFGVDVEVIWRTVQEDLPPLRTAIARMVGDLENK